jgi:hypothetical protein
MAASRPLISGNPTSSNSGGGYGAPAAAGVGGVLSSMFGNYTNPADAAMQYLNQIPQELRQFLMPYIKRGNDAYAGLNNNYNSMMNDPSSVYNKIASGYKQSPGYQFALKQAMQAGNNSAAAGGMLGTPQNQYMNADVAEGLASRDFENYFGHSMDLFQGGLKGQQGFYNQGFEGSKDIAQALAQALMSQASFAGRGAEADNQRESDFWSGIGNIGSMFF